MNNLATHRLVDSFDTRVVFWLSWLTYASYVFLKQFVSVWPSLFLCPLSVGQQACASYSLEAYRVWTELFARSEGF